MLKWLWNGNCILVEYLLRGKWRVLIGNTSSLRDQVWLKRANKKLNWLLFVTNMDQRDNIDQAPRSL